MISIKSEQEIESMRKSGEITYGALMGLKDFIRPGVTTKDIDNTRVLLDNKKVIKYTILGGVGFLVAKFLGRK